jgi:hypothetical protein
MENSHTTMKNQAPLGEMAIYPHDFINIQISYYLWLLRIIQNEKA